MYSSFKHIIYIISLVIIIGVANAQDYYKGSALSPAQCRVEAEERIAQGDIRGGTRFLNTAAMYFWEKNELDSAVLYFEESLNWNDSINNEHGMLGIHSNLAMIHFDKHDYVQSRDFFELTLVGRKKEGDTFSIISALINSSIVYNALKEHQTAIDYLQEALNLARERSDIDQMKSCYGMLAEAHEKMGQTDSVLHYFDLYRSFHESVQRTRENEIRNIAEKERLKALLLEAEKKNAELEIKAKESELVEKSKIIDQQDSRVKNLMQENTKQDLAYQLLKQKANAERLELLQEQHKAEQELQQAKFQEWVLLGISGFLVIISLGVFFFMMQIRRKNKLLESQKTELRGQRKQLQATNAVKDKLFSIISHDLRSPFNSYLSFLYLFEKGHLSEEKKAQFLNQLKDMLKNTMESLDNILGWARSQMEMKASQSTKIVVSDWIEQLMKFAQPAAMGKEIQLINEVENSPDAIWADEDELHTIVRNLLSNAIKFTPKGGMVKCSVHSEGGYTQIMVEDTGLGIPADKLDLLFNQEHHITTRGTNNEKGTGLGLKLSFQLAEKNNGKLRVRSIEGEGSLFILEVPTYQETTNPIAHAE